MSDSGGRGRLEGAGLVLAIVVVVAAFFSTMQAPSQRDIEAQAFRELELREGPGAVATVLALQTPENRPPTATPWLR